MQHCHCSQLLSGAAAGPPHRLPPPPVLLQVGRHTLRPCASYHGGLPLLSAALWCGCRAVQSVHAALSSFLRMHEHSFRLHACPAVHGLAARAALQWVARRRTSEARTAGHGGQDLVAMTAFICLWSLCASTGAQKLSSCPPCMAWHPRIMTLRSVCGLMTRRYADCMLAACFQYATDASFQIHAGLHFCGITPWVCQHRTAALPVELTSDSYMAGIRSWPLSFRLLGSKSACIVARRHHTIEGRVADAFDYLGHADAYKVWGAH